MVAGLKFLSKKSFHPQNKANQEQVWIREQRRNDEERRARERAAQLQKERDEQEWKLQRGEAEKVNFLYQLPPGMEDSKPASATATAAAAAAAAATSLQATTTNDLSVAQPGDDAAAAAFRKLLAGPAPNGDDDDDASPEATTSTDSSSQLQHAFRSSTLQGSTKDAFDIRTNSNNNGPLSALEQSVGIRPSKNSQLTLDEQIQRFPVLAQAPREHGATNSVRFQPLGATIRNTRCMKCGIWGHNRGDRECQLSGWDPFAVPTTTRETDEASKESHHKRKKSYESDSSSSSSEESRRKHRKKSSKKHKKHKRESKKKHRKQHR